MSGHEGEIQQFEQRLSRILARGIAISELVLAAGLVQWAAGVSPSGAIHVIEAGLLALMITPAVRVTASLVEYVKTREWFFAATTLFVISVLIVTLWTALHVGR